MTSVRYSCKTLQTSNMNDIIILVKIVTEKTENKKTRKQENKRKHLYLIVTIDFNGSMLVKKIITDWKGPSRFRKWAKTKLYDRDRDWPVSTIGITELRENFSRDRDIEESYWGPLYE